MFDKSKIALSLFLAGLFCAHAYPQETSQANELEALRNRISALEAANKPAQPSGQLIFNGYARSGFGLDDSGNVAAVFSAPGSQAKFRLGNEADTYIETAFTYQSTRDNAPFSITFRPSYGVPDARSSQSNFSVREMFAQIPNTLKDLPTVSFWAGERFYKRKNINMNDFYFHDMSGFGGGIEGIPVRYFGELSIAWLGGSIDTLTSNGSETKQTVNAKSSVDIRLEKIPIWGGEGEIWLDLATMQEQQQPNNVPVVFDASNGVAVGLTHTVNITSQAQNAWSIFYGQGAAYNFKSTLSDGSSLGNTDENPVRIHTKDLKHWRLINKTEINTTRRWQWQSVAIFDRTSLLGTNQMQDWASLGIRPGYHFSNNFGLISEFGIDYTNRADGDEGTLFKATLAPRIAAGPGWQDRPVLRAYLTYAFWSDAFVGKVANQSYGDTNKGISYGVQMEAWW